MGFGGVFGIGRFDNGVDRVRFLVEIVVNVFGYVNVVVGGVVGIVCMFFSFDGDGLCWVDSFVKFVGNVMFFIWGVFLESVFIVEMGRNGVLLLLVGLVLWNVYCFFCFYLWLFRFWYFLIVFF